MQVLISGHSKGIGKALFDHFSKKEHEVIGYSRSNNFDLSKPHIKAQFMIQSLTSDIVVLNAHIGYENVKLLYDICRVCKGQTNKAIIVLGSHSTETTKNFLHQYQIEKLALEEAARQIQNLPGYPTIIVVRPGYVDTDSVKHINAAKMSAENVADLIGQILDLNASQNYKILNILLVPK